MALKVCIRIVAQGQRLCCALGFLLVLAPFALRADVVCLQNGDCLRGKIIEQTASELIFEHPNLGRMDIPIAETATKGQEVNKPLLTEKVLEEPPQWQFRVSLGISGEEGNDVSFLVRTGFSALYEDKFDRWDIETQYLYETEDRKQDENKGHIRITRDWLQPETPWFYFSQGSYHFDKFKYWEHRVTLFAGPGYDFIQTDKFDLTGRLGIGGSRTWGVDNRLYPEGQLGVETAWRPNDINQISASVTLFPDLEDPHELRAYSRAEWRIKPVKVRDLSIRFGVEHEYESEINENESDERHFDLIYFWDVELEF